MNNRTPMPWTITGCAGGWLIERSRNPNERVVRGSGGVKRYEDAVLIAAAPELLAACEFALSVIKSQGMFDLSERIAVERLEAAIGMAGA